MLKNKKILRAVMFLILFSAALPGFGKGVSASKALEGTWQGILDTGPVKFRVALVLKKGHGGKLKGIFNNIDDGIYNEPLKKLSAKGSFLYAALKTGETFELRLSDDEASLQGNYVQAGGHFQKEGKVTALVLNRGESYLVPRLDAHGKAERDYVYAPPAKLSDGWESADLREAGGDVRKLQVGVKKILTESFPHIHGLVVVKQGKLVLDEYFYGYGPGDEHSAQSMTKSVFSLLFGIAVDQNLVQLDQKLYDYFPIYHNSYTWKPAKSKITLRMLLTMTSGLGCDDWKAPQSCSWQMVGSHDWLDYSLLLPLDHSPGEHFAYCGACLTPLSALLDRFSGMTVAAFAQKNLFGPMGIQDVHWIEETGQVIPVSFGLTLKPRDMAKIGILVLKKGSWNEKPIVSEKWVKASTSIQVPKQQTNRQDDYGYLWWARTIRAHGHDLRVYYAWGVGGNYLFVAPKLDLVCVVTGGNTNSPKLGANSFKLFQDYVVGAFN